MDSSGQSAPDVRQPGSGCYPYGFLYELKGIFKLAWPTSLSILFHYFIQPVSLMFCGHLGKTELASAAMAISVIYITCVSVGRGLAFGGDTFFSQTYGSSNKKIMGIYLQKGLIFGVFCAIVIWAVLLNTETILLLLRQDSNVARMAQEYTQLFMPGALAYCWIFTLMRYLLCQNSVIPNLLICVASCAVNAILHYGLVYQAEMGIRGSAIALAMTYYMVLILLVSYIWGSGIYRETWPGWTWKCLEDWGEFSKVAVSSIFMTFIFWFCTEVGTFLAGLLGEEDISAFSICFQVEGFAWMIPLGVGSASTARIGQYLGAKHPLGAVTTCRVALTVQAFISVIMGLAVYLLRFYIPLAFSSNKDLVNYTGQILPLVALFVLLEGFGGVGISIVRGTGRQTLGAVIIFISYYVFALPVGIPLMFATQLGLAGIWWGFVLGLAVQNFCLLLFVARMDWQKESDNAQVRAGVSVVPDRTVNQSNVGDESQEQVLADERRGLLADTTERETSNPIEGEPRFPVRLVLLRLLVLLLVCLVLAAGVCVRLFVHVETSACIPATIHNATTVSPSIDGLNLPTTFGNKSLPYCNNETIPSSSYIRYEAPYYRVWV